MLSGKGELPRLRFCHSSPRERFLEACFYSFQFAALDAILKGNVEKGELRCVLVFAELRSDMEIRMRGTEVICACTKAICFLFIPQREYHIQNEVCSNKQSYVVP